MKKTITVILILGLCTLSLAAQAKHTEHTFKFEKGSERPMASVKDLAWLEGHWRGTGLGGVVEELWSAPSEDALLGAFRLLKDGKTVFSELVTIVDDEGSLVLKVKHFTPEFVGWEEKGDSVDFRLVKLEPYKAYFGGLTIERVGANKLKMYLAMKSRAGELNEMFFEYDRVVWQGADDGQ